MQTTPPLDDLSQNILNIITSTVEKYNIENSAHEIAKQCTKKITKLKGIPKDLTKEQIYAKVYYEVRVVAERLKPAFIRSHAIASSARASILLHTNE